MKNPKRSPGEYVRDVAEQTRQYLSELRLENQAIREQLTLANAERARAEQLLELHQREHAALLGRLAGTEEQNRQLSSRCVEVEQQTTNLSNLYVASYRLHETLDRPAVLKSIEEIINNIIGSEELGVFEVAPESPTLCLVDSMGIDPSRFESIPVGAGLIGGAVARKEIYVRGDAATPGRRLDCEEELTACIPLMLGSEPFGAIAIFRLLPQKPALEPVDHELFELLANQVAMALYCTRLHAQAAPGPRG